MNKSITNNYMVAADQWAALDLGSNSFHMLLVKRVGASFIVVERLKEKVQLLGGITDGRIQADAQRRGLACIARFMQRLDALPEGRVIAMGTCALRIANNAEAFVQGASDLLPGGLEVISGDQEARLIYLAVAHHLGVPQNKRLVIDIGGGSTEFALGNSDEAPNQSPQTLSIDIGCVAFKDLFFSGNQSQADSYLAARKAARQLIELALVDVPLDRGDESTVLEVCGTSGTIESIQTVLRAHGWSSTDITADGLAQLEHSILAGISIIDAGLPGLPPDRVDIFAAGLAIMSACFEVLGLERVVYTDVTLLQGMICDNLSRKDGFNAMATDLARDSLNQLAARFGVDEAQASRVSRCVQQLFDDAGAALGLAPDDQQLLDWAARVHEVGVHVNSRHYHRHGGYIIKHTELPGISESQKNMLALLVRGHRRSMPGLAFQAFDPQQADRMLRIVILLRLAVILERSHTDSGSARATLRVEGNDLHLACADNWVDANPLSRKELRVEADQLSTAGFTLYVDRDS